MRVALATLLLLACAACGIGPTEVVRAGEPAGGFVMGTRVYLVYDGRLRSVGRPQGPLDAAGAVELLAGGPTGAEQDKGFTTSLPKNLAVRVRGAGFTLEKGTPMPAGGRWQPPVTGLPRLATGQLVCTIAHAEAARRSVKIDDVLVTVPGDRRATCGQY